MEEEPTAIAPDLEKEKEFIIQAGSNSSNDSNASNDSNEPIEPINPIEPTSPSNDDEFDLSDITHQPKELSREEIIAAAEAAAYEA